MTAEEMAELSNAAQKKKHGERYAEEMRRRASLPRKRKGKRKRA